MKIKSKLTAFLSALLISCSPAYASISKSQGNTEQSCKDLGEIAKFAVEFKQMGVSKDVVKNEAVPPDVKSDKNTSEILYTVIDMAYQLPVFNTKDKQLLAQETMKNYVYLTCLGK